MLIVGEEKKKRTISIRRHGQEGKGMLPVTIEEFASIVDEEIQNIKSIYSLT
jgi:threonyl-tRNA synthetase